jgi:Ni,Fe-hydrogenase I cytochrome b subunit
VRRTTRIVRHIDPWSVFRVTLVFHFVLYLTLLLTGVLLWNVANATGTVDNVERFMESFGWDTFQFKGGELFHQAWVLGLFVVIGVTGLAILAVTTFNLITDLVGGIRVTILEGKPEAKKSPKPAKRAQQSPTSRVDRP